MARSRKLSPERKEFVNSLIEHYHPEDDQVLSMNAKGMTTRDISAHLRDNI